MGGWAYLETAPNQVVAEMWQDMLAHEGIPAMIHPEDTGSYYGVITRPVRLMVAGNKLEAARKVLAQWEGEGSESADEEAGEEAGEGAET